MKTDVKTHHFVWNGDPPDHRDRRYCVCNRVDGHPAHEVPDQTPEAAELDARTMGEA